MNKLIKLITLLSLVALFANIGYATNVLPPKDEIAKGVYIDHQLEPYRIDRLYVIANEKYKEIYISEGNEIKEVKALDIDSDGKNEYLVSMFTGGSGGFYDIAIIKEKQDGNWNTIWQDSFAQPSIELEDNDGEITVKIEHYEKINDTPQKVTSVINYENEKIVKH